LTQALHPNVENARVCLVPDGTVTRAKLHEWKKGDKLVKDGAQLIETGIHEGQWWQAAALICRHKINKQHIRQNLNPEKYL
jgi:hypothetical protein